LDPGWQIIEKLSVTTPSGVLKLKLLKEIATENNVKWDSTSAEADLLKVPQDLLVRTQVNPLWQAFFFCVWVIVLLGGPMVAVFLHKCTSRLRYSRASLCSCLGVSPIGPEIDTHYGVVIYLST
jgi:hypothetical protein